MVTGLAGGVNTSGYVPEGHIFKCCENHIATAKCILYVNSLISLETLSFDKGVFEGREFHVGDYIPSCPTCGSKQWYQSVEFIYGDEL